MRVELISRTVPFDNDLSERPISEYIEWIARISTDREAEKKPGKLFKYLIDNAHWSPFEHYYYSFEITTSRAISRQLLRHRSFTFQEFSQRYSSEIDFEPFELRLAATNMKQGSREGGLSEKEVDNLNESAALGIKALKTVHLLYKEYIESGISKETARMILPECTSTKIIMTGSLRSWIHFLEVRMKKSKSNSPQKEIMEIAECIHSELWRQIPELRFLFEPTDNGTDN